MEHDNPLFDPNGQPAPSPPSVHFVSTPRNPSVSIEEPLGIFGEVTPAETRQVLSSVPSTVTVRQGPESHPMASPSYQDLLNTCRFMYPHLSEEQRITHVRSILAKKPPMTSTSHQEGQNDTYPVFGGESQTMQSPKVAPIPLDLTPAQASRNSHSSAPENQVHAKPAEPPVKILQFPQLVQPQPSAPQEPSPVEAKLRF